MLLAALFKETTSLDFTGRDVLSVFVNKLEQEVSKVNFLIKIVN